MKNKKIIGIVVGVVVVGLVLTFSLYHRSVSIQSNVNASAKVKYEILDNSVKLPSNIETFVTNATEKQGVFSKQSGKDTFVVISGGKRDTTGFGIGLDSVTAQPHEIDLKYTVVSPLQPNKVTKKETYPHMILKIDNDLRPVKGISLSSLTSFPKKSLQPETPKPPVTK